MKKNAPKPLKDKSLPAKKSPGRKKNDDDFKQTIVIKKSNRIVEARYYLSIWEMRIFQEMIEQIKPKSESFEQVTIPIRSFAKKFGQQGGWAYEAIRSAALDLAHRVVVAEMDGPKGGRVVYHSLAVKVDLPIEEYPDGDSNSYIVLKFNEELKPELLQLSQNYTQYMAGLTMLLKTSYAIRIYEIMAMNRYRRMREISLKDFREMIGALAYKDEKMKAIKKDVAATYGELNRSILRPSHAQIQEKTDIRFDYEPIFESAHLKMSKPGIVGIRFYNIRLKTEDKNLLQSESDKAEGVFMLPLGEPQGEVAEVVQQPTVTYIEPIIKDLFGVEIPPPGKKKARPAVNPDDVVGTELFDLALSLRISRTYLKIAFETHTHERIRAALELIKRKSLEDGGKKIGNPTGYFYTLVNTEGLENQFETVATARLEAQGLIEQQRQKAQHLAQLKKELIRLEDERTQATNDIYQDQINALTELFTIDPQFHRIVFDQVVALPYLKMVVPDLIQKYKEEYLYKTQVYTHFFNEALKLRPDESLFTPILLSMEQLALTEQRIGAIKAELQQG